MLKWQAAPTGPGFYYWQGGKLHGNQVAIVQVTAFRNPSIPREAELLYSDSMERMAPKDGPAFTWGGRWAGPIPQPV